MAHSYEVLRPILDLVAISSSRVVRAGDVKDGEEMTEYRPEYLRRQSNDGNECISPCADLLDVRASEGDLVIAGL